MMELILNDELQLQYPDGFHILSDEERSKLNILEDGEWVGLSEPDLHILVTLACKKINGFASMMLNEQDLVRKMEKQVSKFMRPFAFRKREDKRCLIGGRKACGFGYEYTSQGIDMYAESYLIKKKNTIYYFHFYSRKTLEKDCLPVWMDMLERMTWNQN